MPDVADMQWCFPSRRQHSGVFVATDAKAIGARTPQPITDNTKLASNRRILDRYASTSQPRVTIEPLGDLVAGTQPVGSSQTLPCGGPQRDALRHSADLHGRARLPLLTPVERKGSGRQEAGALNFQVVCYPPRRAHPWLGFAWSFE
jgi:hypothetical protein